MSYLKIWTLELLAIMSMIGFYNFGESIGVICALITELCSLKFMFSRRRYVYSSWSILSWPKRALFSYA